MEMLCKSLQIKTSLYRHLTSVIQQTYFQYHTSFLAKAFMLQKSGKDFVLSYASLRTDLLFRNSYLFAVCFPLRLRRRCFSLLLLHASILHTKCIDSSCKGTVTMFCLPLNLNFAFLFFCGSLSSSYQERGENKNAQDPVFSQRKGQSSHPPSSGSGSHFHDLFGYGHPSQHFLSLAETVSF